MKKILVSSIIALTVALVGAASANAAFTRNLTVGSTGTDVAELQTWLISKGFSIPSISSGAATTGYFGQQTKMAVAAYQATVGLPNQGFFGPLTMAKIAMGGGSVATVPSMGCPAGYTCTANPGTTPSTPSTPVSTTLAGTDGTIETVEQLSQYSDEEVGDGENDVKVVGFEVEASNDGDIALKSIKIALDPAGNTGSDHLDDYIETVTVWQGSTKVGSADADDFSQGTSDDIYTKTITLSNSVVRADAVEKFYISVDAVNNLDSGDISGSADSWTVDIDNIRYEDGSGVVTTHNESESGFDAFNVGIAFVSFSTAANTELKFSTDSSSPDAGIVVVDEDDNTDDVVLLVGKIKVEGTSDVKLDELPVTLTVTTATDVDLVTGNLTLKIDGEEYSESVSTATLTTATTTFNGLKLVLEAGKTYTFTVLADINDIDDSGFTAGSTLKASITSTNVDYVDAENEEGDQLSDSSEKSGTVTGEAQEFRVNGISLTLVSTETAAADGGSTNDDLGSFKIKYKVTAIGDTVYLSSLGNTGAGGLTYTVDKSGTATTSGTNSTIYGTLVNETDTDLTSVGNYMIEEGASNAETFTLSVGVKLGAGSTSGDYRAVLTGIKWGTTDIITLPNTYSSELDSFKTSYKPLN